MKLYLIAEDVLIQEHLHSAFVQLSPQVCASIPLSIENDSVIFIHDALLEGMSEVGLRALFSLHVMVLGITPTFEKAQFYLSMGAKGYGNAYTHASHLLYAYETMLEGNVWLLPEYISRLIHAIPKQSEKKNDALLHLSDREKEVAVLLASGNSHKDIADKLDITVRTVKAHATAIYHKLEIKDRLCLALLLR